MKTSKWFYGIALASFVGFTAAADNVPSSQPAGTTSTLPTLQNNLIIQGTVTTGNNNQGPKPVTKPVTNPNPTPANNNNGVANQGT
ncbi:MAG TPA: hypothetical protein VK742_09310 [Candidatus Sulfotelmatobacter sp.]|nr:hypothetical protein [Candidatus Sulfotelmatobacter sp.]